MKAKITLHIYAKTTKANAAGQLPIYIRLTVDENDSNSAPRNSLINRNGRQNCLK
ncbi:hypothetical protein [Flavobacterium psychrophilum]|uniref:hypothetical protein n=1 Tax=Flavobacterium psychrophilum TaxID=96345 RepID=UPI00279521A1|nr:hypothetical protein [Flavobacterium psychrophilum]